MTYKDREKKPIRYQSDPQRHSIRLYSAIPYTSPILANGSLMVPLMIENCLRNMFFRDKKIDNIQDYLVREQEKPSVFVGNIKEEYKNFRNELLTEVNPNKLNWVKKCKVEFNDKIRRMVNTFFPDVKGSRVRE